MEGKRSLSKSPLRLKRSAKTSVRLFIRTPPFSESDEGFYESHKPAELERFGSKVTLPIFGSIREQGSVHDLDLISLPMDEGNQYNSRFSFKENAVATSAKQMFSENVHPDSFYGSMRFFICILQYCALLPVSGASGLNHESIKFCWRQWKLLYVALVFTGIFFLFFCSVVAAFQTELSYDRSAPLIFYGSGVLGMSLFVDLARNWDNLNQQFFVTEKTLSSHGYPTGQRFQFAAISIPFIACALVEHILSLVTSFKFVHNCKDEQDGFWEVLRLYFINHYKQVFTILTYHHVWGIMVFICNFMSTCCWNLMDLFLGLISLSLSSRLRLINSALKKVQGQEKPTAYWRKSREEYNAVSSLVKIVDGHIQRLMLLSIGNNVFFLCLQLLKGLKGSIDTHHGVYFFWSFGFLMVRTCFVTLSAASIYDESRAGKSVLFSVPHDSFCQEVRRFLTQIISDDLSLSGCRFFSVTRGLILTIAGTIVTYEIVLVQFKSSTGEEYSGSNKTSCMSLNR